jgi:hypothetical protein
MRQLSGSSLVRHLPCIGLDPYRALVHLLGPAEDMEGVAASDTLKEDDADGPDIEGRLHVEFRFGCVSEDGLRGRIAESAARTAVSSCTYKVPDERPIFFVNKLLVENRLESQKAKLFRTIFSHYIQIVAAAK